MPRQARLDALGTLHHAIVRGIEKRRIINETAERPGVSTSAISKIVKRAV